MANEKEPRGLSRWARFRRILLRRFQSDNGDSDAKPKVRQRWIGAAVLIALFVTSYTYFSNPDVELPRGGGSAEAPNTQQEPIVIPGVSADEEDPSEETPEAEAGLGEAEPLAVETPEGQETGEDSDETQAEPEAQPTTATVADASLPALHWPLRGLITQSFGWTYSETYEDWRLHEGIDILAESGSMVVAAATGTVSAIEEEPLWGRVVVVTDGQGVEIRYAGLGVLQVRAGQQVVRGQPLGRLGEPSVNEAAQGAHLHLSARVNDEVVDPLPALGELALDS